MKKKLLIAMVTIAPLFANAGAYLKCECNVEIKNDYERVQGAPGQWYWVFTRTAYHRLWVMGPDLQWNNIQTYGTGSQCSSYLSLLANAGHCPRTTYSNNNSESSEPYYN